MGVRFKWGPHARWRLTWGKGSLRQYLGEEGGTWLGLRKEGRADPGRVEAEGGPWAKRFLCWMDQSKWEEPAGWPGSPF